MSNILFDIDKINNWRLEHRYAHFYPANYEFVCQLQTGDSFIIGAPCRNTGAFISNSIIPFEKGTVLEKTEKTIKSDKSINFNLLGRSTRQVERRTEKTVHKLFVHIYSPKEVIQVCDRAILRKIASEQDNNWQKLRGLIYDLKKDKDADLILELLRLLESKMNE